MKGIFLNLIGITILLAGIGKLQGLPAPVTADEAIAFTATALTEISGTWSSFPAGMMIGIGENGSIEFGLDDKGKPVGMDARAWFREQQFHLVFTDYQGEAAECADAVGVYEVMVLDNGSLKFEPVADDCQFRVDILSGDSQHTTDLLFHGTS
jgi:hypothetical protein